MNALLASPISYVVPSLYLLSLTLLPKKYSIPGVIHILVALAGLSLNIVFNGLGSSLLSLGLASIIFFALVMTGILSKTGTFALPVSLVALPFLGWIAFLPGLFILGFVSIWKIRKVASTGYIASVALDTLNAIGALDALNGKVAKPNLSMLPIPNSNEEPVLEKEINAQKIKVNLNLYLGMSVMLIGLLAYYKSLT